MHVLSTYSEKLHRSLVNLHLLGVHEDKKGLTNLEGKDHFTFSAFVKKLGYTSIKTQETEFT